MLGVIKNIVVRMPVTTMSGKVLIFYIYCCFRQCQHPHRHDIPAPRATDQWPDTADDAPAPQNPVHLSTTPHPGPQPPATARGEVQTGSVCPGQ